MADKKQRSREDKDFVKMYRKFIQSIADLSMANPTALKILLFLVRNMDGHNAIGVGSEVIAKMTDCSRQTVSKQIKYLQAEGWLEVMKLGTSNVYIINPEVVWTSYADDKSCCKFKGSFMLSAEDNWEICANKRNKGHYKFIDPAVLNKLTDQVQDAVDNIPGQMNVEDFI